MASKVNVTAGMTGTVDNSAIGIAMPSGIFLPAPNRTEELQLVARNDEHMDSMLSDETFVRQIHERNGEANQLVNLNQAALTQAGDNAAQNATILVKNDNEDWINHKWRPAMGWMYMIVCIFDFILFPILWSILQAVTKGSVTTPWQPLTLQGAGLFHLAMGAVLGITAYGRTQEKIESSVSATASAALNKTA